MRNLLDEDLKKQVKPGIVISAFTVFLIYFQKKRTFYPKRTKVRGTTFISVLIINTKQTLKSL
mgnify:CR=1 FL=1